MIFETSNDSLVKLHAPWDPGELDIENYIVSKDKADSKAPQLDPRIFGETLLVLQTQVFTKQQKRADIVAIDQQGYGVFIELKRREGRQGVETQALQYLANYSNLKGKQFLSKFSHAKARIDEFLGDYDVDKLNAKSRIILLARSFDDTIFSMGEWLAAQGVAFRCIEYEPFKIGARCFLNFSVRFDRTKDPLYLISAEARDPEFFWHNIGSSPIKASGSEHAALDEWWRHHWKEGMISAGFSEEPGDAGDRMLNSYIAGDTVIAYASGYGAIGWGVMKSPRYELISTKYDRFSAEGNHRHRLKGIEWKLVAESVENAIDVKTLKERFQLNHPIQTKSRVRRQNAEALFKEMKSRFSGPK